MKKDNNKIKVIIDNPPTKTQAEERIKKLSIHLSAVWNKPQNAR